LSLDSSRDSKCSGARAASDSRCGGESQRGGEEEAQRGSEEEAYRGLASDSRSTSPPPRSSTNNAHGQTDAEGKTHRQTGGDASPESIAAHQFAAEEFAGVGRAAGGGRREGRERGVEKVQAGAVGLDESWEGRGEEIGGREEAALEAWERRKRGQRREEGPAFEPPALRISLCGRALQERDNMTEVSSMR
jgi:hypothetical protein